MGQFITDGQSNVDELENLFKKMQQEYKVAANFYCEDPTQMKPDELFSIFQKFTDSYLTAKQDNEREERAQQKKEAKLSKSNREQGKGVIDDLADSLRSGDIFRKRLQQKET